MQQDEYLNLKDPDCNNTITVIATSEEYTINQLFLIHEVKDVLENKQVICPFYDWCNPPPIQLDIPPNQMYDKNAGRQKKDFSDLPHVPQLLVKYPNKRVSECIWLETYGDITKPGVCTDCKTQITIKKSKLDETYRYFLCYDCRPSEF